MGDLSGVCTIWNLVELSSAGLFDVEGRVLRPILLKTLAAPLAIALPLLPLSLWPEPLASEADESPFLLFICWHGDL